MANQKQKVWTKQCPGHVAMPQIIPDDYDCCDTCLADKYELKIVYGESSFHSDSYEMDSVHEALRLAEKGSVAND